MVVFIVLAILYFKMKTSTNFDNLTTNQAWQLIKLIEAVGKCPPSWEKAYKKIIKKTKNED